METQKKISICLTENGQVILSRLGVAPNDYGSAYQGESAGLDLFNMGEEVSLPGRTAWSVFGEPPARIPVGVRVRIPEGYVGLIKERGSITNSGLSVRAGVIDPGYTGEIFVSLINHGEKVTTIQTGAKLPVQLIVVPCINSFESVNYTEFLQRSDGALRQEAKLGSSNT